MNEDDKDEKRQELNEVAEELIEKAVPIDKGYPEIVEENALKFIYENYDEEQREEIFKTLEREKNGNILWKGENGDIIKLKYSDGKLVKGVLKDRNEEGYYEKVKFKVRDDGYIYKERNHSLEDGIHKEKIKVKEKEDGEEFLTISMRRSDKDAYSKFVEKAKVILNDRDDVVELKGSQSTTNVDTSGLLYEKESLKVRVDGDTEGISITKKEQDVFFNPLLGFQGKKSVTNTKNDDDGNTTINMTEIGGSVGLFNVAVGARVENTELDKYGNSHTKGFGGAVGISGSNVYAGVELNDKMVQVDAGGKRSEISSSFEANAGVGIRGVNVCYKTEKDLKNADGTEYARGDGVSFSANLMGVGVRSSSLKKNKDGETNTTVISDMGMQVSPLITENRIVDQNKVIINGEEFENGIDVGVKNNTIKRMEKVVKNVGVERGKMMFDAVENVVEDLVDDKGPLPKMMNLGKEFLETTDSNVQFRTTVFDDDIFRFEDQKQTEYMEKENKTIENEENSAAVITESMEMKIARLRGLDKSGTSVQNPQQFNTNVNTTSNVMISKMMLLRGKKM